MSESVEAFFYGLYMDPDLLESLGFKPESVEKARLDDYVLDLHGSAKIISEENAVVWGHVIRLPKNDLTAMYSFESTKAYSPETVQVQDVDGNCKTVSCYNVPKTAGAPFNREYFNKLVQLLQKQGFPADYILSLQLSSREN